MTNIPCEKNKMYLVSSQEEMMTLLKLACNPGCSGSVMSESDDTSLSNTFCSSIREPRDFKIIYVGIITETYYKKLIKMINLCIKVEKLYFSLCFKEVLHFYYNS